MTSSPQPPATPSHEGQPTGGLRSAGTVFQEESDPLRAASTVSSALSAPTVEPPPFLRRHRQRRTTLPRSTRGWSRAIVWSLIGLTGVSILYGMFGRVDRSISATGTLRPVGGVTAVSSPINTVVNKVLVKDGQKVSKGQTLLQFDQASLAQQRQQLLSQQRLWKKEKALLASQLGLPVDPGITSNAKRELEIETYEVELRRQGAAAEEERSRIAISQQQTTLAALRKKYAINDNIAKRMERLVAQGALSQIELDRHQERQVELLSTIGNTEHEIASAKQRRVQSAVQEKQVPVANLKKLYAQYDTAEQQLSDVSSRLIDVEERLRLGRLLAPVSGIVFDISVKPGEVPRGDKPLLRIVPQDSLEAELAISNLDIGHLKVGMPVDVRVNSFPFTEYGSIKGELVSIGADAKEPTQQVPTQHFIAVATLDRDKLAKDGESYPLRAGMAVTGLVKMGTRSVLSLVSDRFQGFMDSPKTIR